MQAAADDVLKELRSEPASDEVETKKAVAHLGTACPPPVHRSIAAQVLRPQNGSFGTQILGTDV